MLIQPSAAIRTHQTNEVLDHLVVHARRGGDLLGLVERLTDRAMWSEAVSSSSRLGVLAGSVIDTSQVVRRAPQCETRRATDLAR